MNPPDEQWEARLRAVLASIDSLPEDEYLAAVLDITGELADGDPVALFERGGAYDSTGHPEQAVALYEAALAAGLSGGRRRRTVIQMASSRRNLGDSLGAYETLTAEAQADSDELNAAVATFRALALADLGREREGLSLALSALATYLPRYNRSVARYAEALLDPTG